MKLEDRREAYKAFFTNHKAGQELLALMHDARNGNLSQAENSNSLDYLSRAKGNKEIIDLIDNVLRAEVKQK